MRRLEQPIPEDVMPVQRTARPGNGVKQSDKIYEIDDSRRLQLLIDAVVDYAIYMISLDGHVLSWNSGGRRLKGYESHEIIGQPFSRFFTAEDQANGLPQRALASAAKEGMFETEGWRVRKDGTRFWALAVLNAMNDETGDLVGFVNITRDLTERQLAHQRLLEREQHYRRLIEAVVDYAVFQLDVDGNVISWNPGAERIKGYRADEIIGQHFSRFYTAEDRDAGAPERALRTAAQEGKYEAEGRRCRKDGSMFEAFVVIDPIRDENDKLVGFAKITRDITERVEAHKALRASQEQLAMSQKMEAVGQLSGGIAHDFNNLLMIVQGNLETVQRHIKDISNTNLHRAVNNALRGAQRAVALTSRLLAFSRRQAIDPKPLDVNKFLSGAVDFLQRSLGETIEVEAVGAGGLWQVEVDANHLETALVNLAINARDAMPSGGKLTLEAANVFLDEEYVRINPEVTPGQFVVICVSDTGHGMTPEVLSRAFEPFFTTKEIGQGTGLGLSQVYGFVKQSGGHIKIYSEEGQGTTVKIYLRRLAKRATDTDAEVVEPGGEGEQGEVILVVEDDSDLRAYIVDVLRELKYIVLSAADPETALAMLKQHDRVDLLLTDVVMPGRNGRELAEAAKALRAHLRVLFMTGYSRNAVVHQGRLDEGVELLQKPISQAELATRVRDILDRDR
jgi:PAS domain S-box-containing protein